MDSGHPSLAEPAGGGFTLIELLVVVAIIAILASIAIPNFMDAQTRAKVARVKSDMRILSVAVGLYCVDWNAYPCMDHHALEHNDGLLFMYSNFMNYDGREGLPADSERCACLTTPVAYLSSPPQPDPFIGKMALSKMGSDARRHFGRKNCSYFFYNFKGAAKVPKTPGGRALWPLYMAPVVSPAPMRFNGPDGPVHQAEWAMLSPGPDRTFRVDRPLSPDNPWMSYQFLYDHDNWNAMLEGRHAIYDPSNGTVSAGDLWRTNQGCIP